MFCGSPLKQPDRELKKEVAGWGNKSLSYIQHTLHKRLSLPSRPAAEKPLLTEVVKRKRLAVAKKYHQRTKKDIGEKTMKINNSRVGQPIVFLQISHSPLIYL
jgi:hypothetical protein